MPIIALLAIAFVSLFVVRVGATAFVYTGLSRSVAQFQALSCFFGVGYTTAESEMIVGHPIRRRIATHLIILGNLGIFGALGAVMVSMLQFDPDWIDALLGFDEHSRIARVGAIAIILASVFLAYRLGFVCRVIDATVRYALERAGSALAVDYDTVLRVGAGYAVVGFDVPPEHPFVGATLEQLGLGGRGVLVLHVVRATGEFVPTPSRTTRIEADDVLTVYGDETVLHEVMSGPDA